MGRLILVADDSSTIQKVIKIAFARYRIEIIEAASYIEALAVTARHRPEALIIDASLPGAKGPEDFAKLRQEAGHVPVLVLIGTYEAVDESAFRQAGFAHVMKKPFDTGDITAKIEALLGESLPQEQPAPHQVVEPVAEEPALVSAGPSAFTSHPAAPPLSQAAFSSPAPVPLNQAQSAYSSSPSPRPLSESPSRFSSRGGQPVSAPPAQLSSRPLSGGPSAFDEDEQEPSYRHRSEPGRPLSGMQSTSRSSSMSTPTGTQSSQEAPRRRQHTTVIHPGGLPGLGELPTSSPSPTALTVGSELDEGAPYDEPRGSVPPPPAVGESQRGRRAFSAPPNATAHIVPPPDGQGLHQSSPPPPPQRGSISVNLDDDAAYTNASIQHGPTIRRAPTAGPLPVSEARAGASLKAVIAEELPPLVRLAVEEYCERHFKSLAREIIAAELRRLADDKARHLVDN